MAGLMGGGRRAPTEQEKAAQEAQSRSAERAEAQERAEMAGLQERRSRMRRGGMRLLFSPIRRPGSGSSSLGTKLGVGD